MRFDTELASTFMAILNRPAVGGALTLGALAPTLFAITGPNLYDLRQKASDIEGRKHLRSGQIIGTIGVIILGAGIMLITPGDDSKIMTGNDALIFYTAVAAAALIAGSYQYALNNPI